MSKVLLAKDDSGSAIAEGVEYTTTDAAAGQGQPIRIQARKEVVVAAGAMSSPRILEHSGIGSADLLRSLGIDVFVDNPHVGENLQNHVIVGTNFEVSEDSDMPSRDPLNRQEPEAIQAATAKVASGKGPLTTSGNNAYAQLPFPEATREEFKKLVQTVQGPDDPLTTPSFAKAHEDFVHSVLSSPDDVPVIYMCTPTFAPWDAEDPTFRPPGRWYAVAVMNAHPLSRGSVHVASRSSTHAPALDPRFLSHPLDAEVLAAGLRYARQTLGSTEPLARHLRKREPEVPDRGKDLEYVYRTVSGGNHWVGSCAMMPREMGGVVDSQLRVYGCKNLRVCDASVVTLVPRGNTQSIVYAVAEIAADIIKKSL